VREDALLAPDDEDDRILEPLGVVQRHQRDEARVVLARVGVSDERDLLEEQVETVLPGLGGGIELPRHLDELEQNYRSTQTILDAANAVIAHNRDQMQKHLWTDLGEGDKLVVRELDDEHAEARYVAGEIERMVDEGLSRSEIAIFYRMNSQSRVLEDTVVRREIGYQVIGGTRFYERAEIKDAMAYLTLLANPQDAVGFQRVANTPRRGIGQTSLSRVLGHANTMGISVWDAAADPAAVPGLGSAAVKAIGRFMETMTSLRERAERDVPVGDLLDAILHESGYLDWLEAERTIEAQGR
jgi:DNA helicase-2/ATP-dependent DNA helicase PcrA